MQIRTTRRLLREMQMAPNNAPMFPYDAPAPKRTPARRTSQSLVAALERILEALIDPEVDPFASCEAARAIAEEALYGRTF